MLTARRFTVQFPLYQATLGLFFMVAMSALHLWARPYEHGRDDLIEFGFLLLRYHSQWR